jgi:heme exporter protein CcmD
MTSQFTNFQEFLQMDGYAGFVWTAWGIAFVAMFALAIRAYRSENFWRGEVEKFEAQLNDKKQADNENP